MIIALISRGGDLSEAKGALRWCVAPQAEQAQLVIGHSPIASNDQGGSCHRLATLHLPAPELDQALEVVLVAQLVAGGAPAASEIRPQEDASDELQLDAPCGPKMPPVAMASVGCPSVMKVQAGPASPLLHPGANQCGHPPNDRPHQAEMLHQDDQRCVAQAVRLRHHQQADDLYPAIDPSGDRRDQDCAESVVDVNP